MAEEALDVKACLEQVKQGDEDAARSLLRHLHPCVIRIVRAHKPPRESEEDVVQNVFIKVFTRLDQYAGQVPLEHWVSRIAVNTCINQLKREKARPELRWADLREEDAAVLENLAPESGQPTLEELVASRELVEQLLARLPPADRLVVSLLHLDGHTVEEVRQITGWNIALIKVRAFRARLKLRKHLHRLLREERKT